MQAACVPRERGRLLIPAALEDLGFEALGFEYVASEADGKDEEAGEDDQAANGDFFRHYNDLLTCR